MGDKGTTKDQEVEKYSHLSKCNDCEHDIRLSSEVKLIDAQLDELHKRMLCPDCLNKRLEAKK